MAKFEPGMKQRVSRVESGASSHIHYLSKKIQKITDRLHQFKNLEAIVKEIKTSKYFFIILDCTSDLSHKEQFSVIIRIPPWIPKVKEYFLGFLVTEEGRFVIPHPKKARGAYYPPLRTVEGSPFTMVQT